MKRTHEETDAPRPLDVSALTTVDTWIHTFEILRQQSSPEVFVKTMAAVSETCRSLHEVLQYYPVWMTLTAAHALAQTHPALYCIASRDVRKVHKKLVTESMELALRDALAGMVTDGTITAAEANAAAAKIRIWSIQTGKWKTVRLETVVAAHRYYACWEPDGTYNLRGDMRDPADLLRFMGWSHDKVKSLSARILANWKPVKKVSRKKKALK